MLKINRNFIIRVSNDSCNKLMVGVALLYISSRDVDLRYLLVASDGGYDQVQDQAFKHGK